MDVAWQDNGASFLDSAGNDPSSYASFASDDGGTLWSSSTDSPVFSAQSVLWESGADSPSDSPISALTADYTASGTDTGALLAGGWIADAGAGFTGGRSLDGGLLWSGASSDTWGSLASNGGVGLGALDLGAAGSTSSQWQQFVDQFAGGSATGLTSLTDTQPLLWTGPASQPAVSVPAPDSSLSLQVASIASMPLPTVGSLSPTQVVWTQPSGATGLTNAPSLAAAAPTTLASTLGGPVQDSTGLPTSLGVTR